MVFGLGIMFWVYVLILCLLVGLVCGFCLRFYFISVGVAVCCCSLVRVYCLL